VSNAAENSRPWYALPVAALAAMSFANALPHTLAGPLVLSLPTPFSGGPGSLSSPMVNVLWGLSNLLVGYLLVRSIKPWVVTPAARVTMAIAGAAFLVFLTWAIGSLPLPGRFEL
jgi:hypothetical protein